MRYINGILILSALMSPVIYVVYEKVGGGSRKTYFTAPSIGGNTCQTAEFDKCGVTLKDCSPSGSVYFCVNNVERKNAGKESSGFPFEAKELGNSASAVLVNRSTTHP